jgi:hypothetical protein
VKLGEIEVLQITHNYSPEPLLRGLLVASPVAAVLWVAILGACLAI